MFNVNRSTISNELFSEVNNVINHRLTETGGKKFFCTNSTSDVSAAWWEADLGYHDTSWSQGLVAVREMRAGSPGKSSPWVTSQQVFIFQSLVLRSANLVQQDQEGQLMLTRLAKLSNLIKE